MSEERKAAIAALVKVLKSEYKKATLALRSIEVEFGAAWTADSAPAPTPEVTP